MNHTCLPSFEGWRPLLPHEEIIPGDTLAIFCCSDSTCDQVDLPPDDNCPIGSGAIGLKASYWNGKPKWPYRRGKKELTGNALFRKELTLP